MGTSKGNFPKREERTRFGSTRRKENRHLHEKQKKVPPTSYRGRTSKKGVKKQKPFQMRGIAIATVVVLIIIIIFGFTRKNGVEVFVGEKSIGILKDKSISAEDLKKTIVAQLEEELGTKVQINETIQTDPLHISNNREKDVGTIDYMIPKVREAVTYQVAGTAIVVDGSRAAVLANKKQAEEVLNKVKSEYIPKDAKMEVGFVEKVEIVESFVDSKEIVPKEQVIKMLQNTTEIQKKYTVVSNDSLYSIAKDAEMTVEKLLEINRGLTLESSLKVGQVLNIMVKKPYVSVKTVETRVMTDIEPKTYEYRTDPSKNKGYQKVIQQGKAGQKESTVQITRINGFVEEEKEVSKKITVEPVPEIIVQGSK